MEVELLVPHSDGPDVVGTHHRDRTKDAQPIAARRGHDGPTNAVPVLGHRSGDSPQGLADRPHIVHRNGLDPEEPPPIRPEVWTLHHAPTRTVPMLDQR